MSSTRYPLVIMILRVGIKIQKMYTPPWFKVIIKTLLQSYHKNFYKNKAMIRCRNIVKVWLYQMDEGRYLLIFSTCIFVCEISTDLHQTVKSLPQFSSYKLYSILNSVIFCNFENLLPRKALKPISRKIQIVTWPKNICTSPLELSTATFSDLGSLGREVLGNLPLSQNTLD